MHTVDLDDFEWDPAKAALNVRKHGVRFSDAVLAVLDPGAVTHDAGRATPRISERLMRKYYDFSKGKRGPVVRVATAGKTRITIRLDDAVLEWFKQKTDDAGGGNYQSLINAALKDHIQREREPLEATLRRVVREELKRLGAKVAAP